MFALRRIRSQMYFGVIMLLIIVTVLSAASLQGVMKFRKLTKSIRERSLELPQAAELGLRVSELRSTLWQVSHPDNPIGNNDLLPYLNGQQPNRFSLIMKIQAVERALESYQIQLETSEIVDPTIAENTRELDFVVEFTKRLKRIKSYVTENTRDWAFNENKMFNPLEEELSSLQRLAAEIPVYMQERMDKFAEKARTEYRAWMTVSVFLGFAAIGMIGFLMVRFRDRIVRPLETLVEGSRQVAAGNYDYRIELNTDDEVAELAEALNAMTSSFQAIKSDLNCQVQQRTKEVVRSEKMASVGFLAAGVAHEINNPLASIAWSAESLETRIYDILNPAEGTDQETIDSEIEDMKNYLRRIQDEAFRCKGITAGLLDFSRMGDAKKALTNLSEIINSVIGMVKPLSKYRDRNIEFNGDNSILAVVNEQEMKQVALNLITNALGSLEESGTVKIELVKNGDSAELSVTDDGCGMTEEVRQHLFEPFFTRRRDGQGTGLGLSITYQIIEEHGGRITATSEGPGRGSVFMVRLPLVKNEKKQLEKSAA